MAKKDSRYIRGPIGEGTPFKQVYNTDGTPNYPQAVQQQAKTSAQNASKQNSAPVVDKGKGYENEFIRGLQEGMAKIEKELGGRPNVSQPNSNMKQPSKEQQRTVSPQQSIEKNASKNEPEIDK